MRVIKFRAWDLNEDEYIPWEHLIQIRYNEEYYRDNHKIDVTLSFMTDRHLIKEQWTGLLDKNGKGIYEGDIVTFLYPEIAGITGKSAVYWSDERAAFVVDDHALLGSRLDFEVIGNIHENSGLLGAK